MRRLFIAAGISLLAGVAMPLLASAQTADEMNASLDSLFGEHDRYHSFFTALKKAVAEGDKKSFAAMVDYPFQARIKGKSVKIRDAAHFVADYDQVVTAKVKHALEAQAYESLFANWQGVMVGDGEIWFSAVGEPGEIRITAIND